MKLMTWVLGAVLTAAPAIYAQSAQNQPTQPQTPAASDQNSATSADQTIYGTGLTAAELKQIGYTDDEVSQMRSDSQTMMASAGQNALPQSDQNSTNSSNSSMPQSDQNASNSASKTASPGTASGNQDQSPSAANGVSQPSDMNNNADNMPQKASSNHAGLWGLLGLLGLLGLAGRAKRQAMVRHDVDTMAERDRTRTMAERDAAERAARDREIVASGYRDQDIVADRDVREQRVREMTDADRNRRRTA